MTERIIVRHHPNSDANSFDVFYPEETANRGRIVCQQVDCLGDNRFNIWSHDEACYDYYLECRPVSKDLARRFATMLSGHYGTKFVASQRINWKKRN